MKKEKNLLKKRIFYFNESSGKENINVHEIFEKCTQIICNNIDKNYYNLNDENDGIKEGQKIYYNI